MAIEMRNKLCSMLLIGVGAYSEMGEILNDIEKEALLNVAA
jgi:hypothetical protein